MLCLKEVYLEVAYFLRELPEPLFKALEPFDDSLPQPLLLPWPREAIPRPGDTIVIANSGFVLKCDVLHITHHLTRGSYNIFIETDFRKVISVDDLFGLVEEGFCLSPRSVPRSLRSILEEANLPTTSAAWRKKFG